MKQLRKQYLKAVDDMDEALRNLRTDYMELWLYEGILHGEIEPDSTCPEPTSIFLRACQNLNEHLDRAERAFSETRAIHKEMMGRK